MTPEQTARQDQIKAHIEEIERETERMAMRAFWFLLAMTCFVVCLVACVILTSNGHHGDPNKEKAQQCVDAGGTIYTDATGTVQCLTPTPHYQDGLPTNNKGQ